MAQNFAKTSSLKSATPASPSALAQDGVGESRPRSPSPKSPALSTASTADGDEEEDDEIESSPAVPALPAPKLSARALQILGTPTAELGEDAQFGTASWGSPYPRSDDNLRRQSFSSEPSEEDLPIHQLDINTPFLRPPPPDGQVEPEAEPESSVSAAATVLANRVRRQARGLTEDWIRTHTSGDTNAEPRHWFSDGSDSEHSSLSGSEFGWFDERDPRTPKAAKALKRASRRSSRHPRARSSVETLKPNISASVKSSESVKMATEEPQPVTADFGNERPESAELVDATPVSETPADIAEIGEPTEEAQKEPKAPSTPLRIVDKPLPKEPVMTPRIKKKVPWRGKNITVLLPRDDEHGLPGMSPRPLTSSEIERMFSSWEELGYSVDGFDLLVEGYQVPGTSDSQSRDLWPNAEDLNRERADRNYKVLLPDLNAWSDYVNELQEAKLRALGVSFAEDEPAPPSPTTNPSRQASAQYPPLPFSPPLPTSSASSNHGMAGFPFPGQFLPGTSATQSPALPAGASPVPFGKFNPRQSISFPTSASPFQFPQQSPQGWQNQAGLLQGLNRVDSPGLVNLNGILSPASPYGIDGFQQAASPAGNIHQRHQSLQYLASQQPSTVSPRLEEVPEAEDEDANRSSSKTPEPQNQNPESLQAEIDDAEYHLEEQLRHQYEHEDYNPQPQADNGIKPLAPPHSRHVSGAEGVPEHFANEPSKPLVLHHPRPHSRGHSLSQGLFREHDTEQGDTDGGLNKLGSLHEIPESNKDDEAQEIETNPSNLGTPVQNLDFATAFGHQKNMSTASNPWHEAPSVATHGAKHSTHSSKPSLSKLNVKAPEFKFNPKSTFTPGLYNFSSDNFQPAAPIMPTWNAPGAHFGNAMPQFQDLQNGGIDKNGPRFSPGQSDFSFSTSGPKFRPDAPSFTPFQSLAPAPPPSGRGRLSQRTDSIFGNIQINTSDIVKPAKKSKAIPIIRPSSRTSVQSPKVPSPASEEQVPDDGRVPDDARVKRARSSAPDGDDVPLFADVPDSVADNDLAKLDQNDGEEADETLPADTSISSIVTSDQMDTKATTAAPSESSPLAKSTNQPPFDFGSKFDGEFRGVDVPKEATEAAKDEVNGEAKETVHKTSLSATAQVFTPGAMSFGESTAPPTPSADQTPSVPEPVIEPEPVKDIPVQASRPILAPKSLNKPKGLAASRFAAASPPAPSSPSPPVVSEEVVMESVERDPVPELEPELNPETQPAGSTARDDRELTFEEIDAVMQHFETDPSRGVNKFVETSKPLEVSMPAAVPQNIELPSKESSQESTNITPRQFQAFEERSVPVQRSEPNDPFIDEPASPRSPEPINDFHEPAMDIEFASDWEKAFSEDEHDKLQNRAQFFDGRVNEIVGNLLASRLEPLEKSLFSIQDTLVSKKGRASSSRRDARSTSADVQDSDADDEEDNPPTSRRDRRMEQIRNIVLEALASQQRSPPADSTTGGESAVLKAIEEMKEHLSANSKSISRNEDLIDLQEESAEGTEETKSPEPMIPLADFQVKVTALQERIEIEQSKTEKEIEERRAAEDAASELNRKLQNAETRVEVEIINRSVYDQRVADLEERLRHQEEQSEAEIVNRRAAEDRLAEIQRQLRIATEEEDRLRDVVEEKDQKVRAMEQQHGKTSMRMALLEAAQNNNAQSQSEMTNKFNALEGDLRNVRQDNNHYRAEAERADETARRTGGELAHVLEENKHMQKSLNTLQTQLEENERLRESWRAKFMSLQEDMGKAAREVAEENAHRIKKDQAMLARSEVLDARLQAEAKTRERLEVELDRLQDNERSGMRAINECTRLEGLLGELRTENHKLQQSASHYKREYEEARESGASEVKRTRMNMQTEIDSANNQIMVMRQDLEQQNMKLRSELDTLKLDANAAVEKHTMLLEEAASNKDVAVEEISRKHKDEVEDMQARHEREINNAVEEKQNIERNLLERLGLATSKSDHLQDRIAHLEDKLEIAKQAAAAAAQAAKSAGVDPGPAASTVQAKPAPHKLELPEKISPQALRESIMVLQEQLQAREQRIEELEQIVAKSDPDAANKISKRDDEISWLRELLAVRHSDLQDIITALSSDGFERERVKDAAIRLKANLQMEEQERERAMNGGSAINLPNIAQSIQAATPKVAQTIGPIAAAWGNWRKGSQPSFRSISGVLGSPGGNNATPSKSRGSPSPQNSLLSGLLTPPASGLRQTPSADNRPQPTAFASTGRRFTPQGNIQNRNRRESNLSHSSAQSRVQESTPPRRQEQNAPMTPPMMGDNTYDEDAQAGEFDDHDFFEEEDEDDLQKQQPEDQDRDSEQLEEQESSDHDDHDEPEQVEVEEE